MNRRGWLIWGFIGLLFGLKACGLPGWQQAKQWQGLQQRATQHQATRQEATKRDKAQPIRRSAQGKIIMADTFNLTGNPTYLGQYIEGVTLFNGKAQYVRDSSTKIAWDSATAHWGVWDSGTLVAYSVTGSGATPPTGAWTGAPASGITLTAGDPFWPVIIPDHIKYRELADASGAPYPASSFATSAPLLGDSAEGDYATGYNPVSSGAYGPVGGGMAGLLDFGTSQTIREIHAYAVRDDEDSTVPVSAITGHLWHSDDGETWDSIAVTVEDTGYQSTAAIPSGFVGGQGYGSHFSAAGLEISCRFLLFLSRNDGTSPRKHVLTDVRAHGDQPVSGVHADNGIVATAGDGIANIYWEPDDSGAERRLYRGTVTGGPYTRITTPDLDGSLGVHKDTGLVNGTTYYYVATTVTGGVEGPQSPEVSCTPQSPAWQLDEWYDTGGDASSLTIPGTTPDYTSTLNALDTPTVGRAQYTRRVKGLLVPAVSGDYTFYVAGDDVAEFWLSPTTDPAGLVKICDSPSVYYQHYDKLPEQASDPQSLVEGQSYYFELRHKQTYPTEDFVSAAWSATGDGGSFTRRTIASPTPGFDSGGGSGTPSPVGAWDIIKVEAQTDTAHDLILPPALPPNATGAEFSYSTDGTTYSTPVAATVGQTIHRTGLTASTRYYYKFRAFNDDYETVELLEVETPAAGGGGGGDDGGDAEPAAPATPSAPIVAKNCAGSALAVTEPSWPTGTTIMEAARDDAPTVVLHTWGTSGGTWSDTTAGEFTARKYRMRAVNGVGTSAWSAWSATATLQSSTLTVTILTPATGATLSNRREIRFQLADSSEEVNPCGTDLPDEDAALQLSLDGLILPLDALQRISGSGRNGIYSLSIDTRLYANASRTLRVYAKDTTGCPQRASISVTLLNTLRRGVLYIQPEWDFGAPTGNQFTDAEVSLQNEALSEHPMLQYWAKQGITSDPAKVVNWADNVISDATKAATFAALQQFTLGQGQIGTTPARTQFFATPTLSVPGQDVIWVQQWTPSQFLSAFETGCERVVQIVPTGTGKDGKYLVFARNMDGTAAKVFTLDSDTWALLYDLSADPYNAPDATSVALSGRALYVVRPGELFAIDLDTGQATTNLAPRGETREPRFVVTAGNTLLWLFVDEALEEGQTKAYSYAPGALVPVWTLDDVVMQVFFRQGRNLALACGTKLYTAAIVAAPALAHTFGAAISALGASDDNWYIGLANGEVWRGDSWAKVVTLPGAVGAVSAWAGDGEDATGVAGGTGAQLTEELGDGSWSDARTLEPPAEELGTLDRVASLCEYVKEVTPATGTAGQPGYVSAVVEEKLLIGTGDDGLLLVVEVADVPQGALLASRVSHLNIDPIYSSISVS